MDQSTGTDLRYLWSFGNGNVSSLQNPEAIYYQPGTYTVSLEVTDAKGKKSYTSKTRYISVYKNPKANFTATPLIGCLPLNVDYTNQSTIGDCSPVRSAIFYPNAFTPNNDNLNDTYVNPGIYIKDYHILIFNRWGEKVYESYNLAKSWDGTFQGELAQQDAYAVIVETTGVDGIRRVHFGTITLIR